MNKNIKISTIIPFYNGSSSIESAILSVLIQTLATTELIIVNDGSNDIEVQKLRDIVGRINSEIITIIDIENCGQSQARNVGIAASTSEFVTFLDQDDQYYPRHNEVLYENIVQNSGVSYSYANVDEYSFDMSLITRRFYNEVTSHPKTRLLDLIKSDLFIVPGCAMFRKSALKMVGGFNAKLRGYEDDDLFIRLFLASTSDPIYSNNESVLKWRIHGSSCSYSYTMIKSRVLFASSLVDLIESLNYRDLSLMNSVANRFRSQLMRDGFNALIQRDSDSIRKIINIFRRLPSSSIKTRCIISLYIIFFQIITHLRR